MMKFVKSSFVICLGLAMVTVCRAHPKASLTENSETHEQHVDEEVEAETLVSDATKLESSTNAVNPSDSYSLYKQLMEVKAQLTGSSSSDSKAQEPAAVTTLKSALGLLYDSLVDGVYKGFFPHVERQRREARDAKKVYLDVAVTTIGAVMGKQNCSRVIACRAGRYFGSTVPNAGLMLMMAENFIPESFRSWFGIVKSATITPENDNQCDSQFHCSLVQ